MKAEKYKIEICDSALDMVHGFTRKIEEYYIPELKIALNCDKDYVNCFTTDENRYKKAKKMGKIDMPEEIVKSVKIYIEAKKELEKIKEWLTIRE